MPVAIAFTLTALAAASVNSWFLIRSYRRRIGLKTMIIRGEVPRRDAPPLNRIAVAFVRIWVAILVVDVLLVIAGVGILEGDGKVFGYLLAVVPVAHILYGVFALRGFEN